jgi:hypothetical protein
VALAAVLAVVVVPVAAARAAGSVECQRAIAKASAKFVRAKLNALRKCEDALVAGFYGGTCPDPKGADRIAAAAAKLHELVHLDCGGIDQRCATGDDEPLAAIGWDGGACPNVDGASCTNAIASCEDVADCVECVATSTVEQSLALIYDELFAGNTIPLVVQCHRAIGRDTEKLFAAMVRARQKCEDRVLTGASTGPCPDAKVRATIAKLTARTTARICGACGGADATCGTSDDLTRLDIGFPAACPSVTVPGGASCAAPVSAIGDIVQCLACTTAFRVTCLDALTVPKLAPYPPECL